MDPHKKDFDKYVERAMDLMGRVPISASDASRRIALDVGLGVKGTTELRQAVELEAYGSPAAGTDLMTP